MQVERGYLDSGATMVAGALDRGGVLVLGPAGAGRTTLLTDLAEIEARQGRRVLWCRGRRHGAPGGEAGGAQGPDQLLALVTAGPVTLLVDDAHLLAGEILASVASVAEQRDQVGVRVAVARRPVRPHPVLAALDVALTGPDGACHLAPLPPEALEAWAVAQGAGGPEPVGADLAEQTGGWPELVAAVLAGGHDAVSDLVRARLGLLATHQQRALCAIAFGLPPGSAALEAATGLDHHAIEGTIEAATADGLLHGATVPVPVVARALRAEAGIDGRAAVAGAARVAPPEVMLSVAVHLAELDDRSAGAGVLFEAAADELRRHSPAVALELYDHAVAAGRAAAPLQAARAEAALAAGQPERAVRITREAPEPGDRSEGRDRVGLLVAAGAAWAHLGRPELAYASLLAASEAQGLVGPAGPSTAAALTVVAHAATRGSGPVVADEAATNPAEAVGLMADAARAWVIGDAARALASLQRSAQLAEVGGDVATWPDSPHALGALVAAHELDATAAERLAAAATERAVGGAAFEVRHRLLAGWGALRTGRIDEARAVLDTTPARSPRDELVKAALTAAVALREGAPGDLTEVQQQAAAAQERAELDLFSVDLAVELAHLAARAGADPEAVLAPLERAAATAAPPYLAVSLAWARLLVASLVENADAAADAAAALAGHAATCAPARVLAPAAHAFARVLAGEVDAGEVRSVAALLADHGLVFEASRLAGAAGLRCTDPSVARQLLADSRRLRGTRRATPTRRAGAVEALSEREREVARAVLDGRSHREIGEALFISAKTVEHHVARIRQKVGARSRSELLAAIRAELALSH